VYLVDGDIGATEHEGAPLPLPHLREKVEPVVRRPLHLLALENEMTRAKQFPFAFGLTGISRMLQRSGGITPVVGVFPSLFFCRATAPAASRLASVDSLTRKEDEERCYRGTACGGGQAYLQGPSRRD
jgi:hypothetical protein